jgi:hypothetical protein
MTSTVMAAMRPATWLRAPMLSLTAVREPLAPTEKPCVTPAAALAAPRRNGRQDLVGVQTDRSGPMISCRDEPKSYVGDGGLQKRVETDHGRWARYLRA